MWPFDSDFMRLALLAGGAVGISAPAVGTFLVTRRLTLLGDGLGHVAFAGVAIAAATDLAPLPVALVASVAGALVVDLLLRRGVVGDLALALLFYGGISAGVIVSSMSGQFDAALLGVLFGQILTVTLGEAIGITLGSALILVVVVVSGPALFAAALDRSAARVSGVPVDALSSLMSVLAAVTVVLSMRVVGVLLVAGLMVLPVGAARALSESFRTARWLSSALGLAAVVIGLALARAFPVAPGGAIVGVAVLIFGVSASVGRGSQLGRATEHGPDEHASHPHLG